MVKYITYVETSIGRDTYHLTFESDEAFRCINNVYYFCQNVRVSKVKVAGTQTNNSPFQESDFYNQVSLPVVSTIMSEKKFEY